MKLKLTTLMLAILMTFTFIAPTVVQAKEVSDTKKIERSLIEKFELSDEEKKDILIISKYTKFDYDRGIPLFDIESAKKDNIENRLLLEAEEFNKSMNDIGTEFSEDSTTYKGSNYFKVMGTNWYRVGLSSGVCKFLTNGLVNGSKWIVTALIAIIPIIGPYAAIVANAIISLGETVLKLYTKTGIVIELRKNIFASGWDIDYWRQ